MSKVAYIFAGYLPKEQEKVWFRPLVWWHTAEGLALAERLEADPDYAGFVWCYDAGGNPLQLTTEAMNQLKELLDRLGEKTWLEGDAEAPIREVLDKGLEGVAVLTTGR